MNSETKAKRGYVPEDERNFSPSAMKVLRTASGHVEYLINEGYDLKQAVTFVGTWKVFNKEYATESTDSSLLASAANLNYWTKLDRENYIKEITEIYNEYVE